MDENGIAPVKLVSGVLETVEDTADVLKAGSDKFLDVAKTEPERKVEEASIAITGVSDAAQTLVSGVFSTLVSVPQNLVNDISNGLSQLRGMAEQIVGQGKATLDSFAANFRDGIESLKTNAVAVAEAAKPPAPPQLFN